MSVNFYKHGWLRLDAGQSQLLYAIGQKKQQPGL
jgi:hypothetical protein